MPRNFAPALRRWGLVMVLGGSVLGGAALVAAPAAAQADCDPSYPDVCIQPASVIGDLDCTDVGYSLTVIHDPSIGAYGSHGFDEDLDGIGCESYQ
jgi:hypothetical protein